LNILRHQRTEVNPFKLTHELWTTEETISSCAVKASFEVKAALIIIFTHFGLTARKVAKHKPKCPILAVTPNDWTANVILMHRGVHSMMVGSLIGSDALINIVLEMAIKRQFVM
jgi:pyruvate kinase